ncbi:MAG TPA: HAD family hydrolase [Firmicutes bacterium]|jgi:FMN phosphatase YigB (HAD superfamily)|nr:HAD family hydrolase [Bacillota bacterium]
MFTTLLFDLDGTLLNINMDIFLPQYFQILTQRFPNLDSDEFITHLLHSTRVMIENKDPRRTNEEVFMQEFIPRIGLPEKELQPILKDFYTNDFGSLGKYTQQEPFAQKIVELCHNKGLEMIIATNPVFPLLAMQHRLKWAGLADYPYRLITAYENMHFCKPHREYYEEILHLLARQPSECLMIGNDIEEDLAAREAGIKTFLVKDHLLDNRKEKLPYTTDYQGYLEDLYRFLKKLYT